MVKMRERNKILWFNPSKISEVSSTNDHLFFQNGPAVLSILCKGSKGQNASKKFRVWLFQRPKLFTFPQPRFPSNPHPHLATWWDGSLNSNVLCMYGRHVIFINRNKSARLSIDCYKPKQTYFRQSHIYSSSRIHNKQLFKARGRLWI